MFNAQLKISSSAPMGYRPCLADDRFNLISASKVKLQVAQLGINCTNAMTKLTAAGTQSTHKALTPKGLGSTSTVNLEAALYSSGRNKIRLQIRLQIRRDLLNNRVP